MPKDIRSPQSSSYRQLVVSQPPNGGCWELNSGLLQEQHSKAEPSLQPLIHFLTSLNLQELESIIYIIHIC